MLFFSLSSTAWGYQEMYLSFYSETVRIEYEQELSEIPLPVVEERALRQFFLLARSQPPSTLSYSLRKARRTLHLNDWLYYELMQKALKELLPGSTQNAKVLWSWVLLSQDGYGTHLAYLEDRVFLYAYTQDEVFDAPLIEDNGRSYINLTDIKAGRPKQRALYLLDPPHEAKGHAFSFQLKELPLLRSAIEEKQVRFQYKSDNYELTVPADRTIARYMASYPILKETYYLKTPLSDTLAQTLYPYLSAQIADKNEWQAVEFLVAFTRSAFQYKEDKAHFGCSKPMVAEELFLYPYSDCEDRSALFFNLVNELLGLPMLLIAYPDHLTIAVALPQRKGSYIRHEGRNYYFCDPTGPADSHEIGRVPKEYENTAYEILKSYE